MLWCDNDVQGCFWLGFEKRPLWVDVTGIETKWHSKEPDCKDLEEAYSREGKENTKFDV